jgi:hypothetical protein
LGETLGSAIVLDQNGQSDNGPKQQDSDNNEQAKAERGLPGQSHNGGDSLAKKQASQSAKKAKASGQARKRMDDARVH